ncbi:unnamed protein product [Bemisia tabaci]|uniref:Uncharacterized protein n=1 Tax=Bemisia tabaci TaxID=7038 RepID=A0A9P0F1J7_BEMTA|nr:unnamed protein product [Bemisia tabaci]
MRPISDDGGVILAQASPDIITNIPESTPKITDRATLVTTNIYETNNKATTIANTGSTPGVASITNTTPGATDSAKPTLGTMNTTGTNIIPINKSESGIENGTFSSDSNKTSSFFDIDEKGISKDRTMSSGDNSTTLTFFDNANELVNKTLSFFDSYENGTIENGTILSDNNCTTLTFCDDVRNETVRQILLRLTAAIIFYHFLLLTKMRIMRMPQFHLIKIAQH